MRIPGTLLALLACVPARAQVDPQVYTTDVCNSGSITVEVATAYHEFYGTKPGYYWVIDRWYRVEPGACKEVFNHRYGSNSLLDYQTFPLHLAFAFTDSSGAWGAAWVTKWDGPTGAKLSKMQLCVKRNDNRYAIEHTDNPGTACQGQAGTFLIPASIDYEPDEGNQWNDYVDEYARRSFTIALAADARAIPLTLKTLPDPAPARR